MLISEQNKKPSWRAGIRGRTATLGWCGRGGNSFRVARGARALPGGCTGYLAVPMCARGAQGTARPTKTGNPFRVASRSGAIPRAMPWAVPGCSFRARIALRRAGDCAPYQHRQPFQGCVVVGGDSQGGALGYNPVALSEQGLPAARRGLRALPTQATLSGLRRGRGRFPGRCPGLYPVALSEQGMGKRR